MSTPKPIVDPYAQSSSAPPRPTGPGTARGPRFSSINPVGYEGVVLAFVSIVFNFLGITAALAIILSAVGLNNSRKLKASGVRMTGRNWCLAGLVIGIAETAVFVASTVR